MTTCSNNNNSFNNSCNISRFNNYSCICINNNSSSRYNNSSTSYNSSNRFNSSNSNINST